MKVQLAFRDPIRLGAILTCVLVGATGCASDRAASPYTPQSDAARDTTKADQLNRDAADMIMKDPGRAELLLRDALAADLYHGPAHNNLGTIYFRSGRLYEAASEFEWARKLLPGHPDPRHNLALTLESAGRGDDAIQTYKTALEIYPEHLPTMQALARLQIRIGRADADTPRLLNEIALRGEPERWRDWARLQLAKSN